MLDVAADQRGDSTRLFFFFDGTGIPPAQLTKIAKQPSARKGGRAIAAPVWPPRRGSLPTDHENFNDPVIFDGFLRSALVKLSLTKSHQS